MASDNPEIYITHLQYVKTPFVEGDFTEEDIKYSIPFKEIADLFNLLRDRIAALELRVDQMSHQNSEEYKRLHELAINAFNS